jgi:lipopolysaccharide/colanic/teichoic acid biosynthesis glycosyltransferase
MAERFLPPSSRVPRRIGVTLFDAAWAALAPVLTFVLRDVPLFDGETARTEILAYCGVAFLVSLFVFGAFRVGDGLTRYFSFSDALLVGKACGVAVAATGLVMFTWTRLEALPRSILVLHCIVLAAGLVASRALTRLHHSGRDRARPGHFRHGMERKNAILIGADRIGFLFLKIIEGNPNARLNVVALLDPRGRLQGRTLSGYRIAGTPDMIGSVIEEYAVHGVDVHRVIIATHRNLLPDGMLTLIDEACRSRGVAPEFLTETMGLVPVDTGQQVQPLHLAAAEPPPVQAATPEAWYWGLKRCIDLTAALVLGLALLPVAAVVALLVYCDVGAPVMFWQQRVGRHGVRFMVYKFRTFHAPYDRWGNPRLDRASLSKIGCWLRRSRLDELPQLYNVLVGEMSLIGPRPLLPIDLPENDDTRLAVRPGLTGWAQVNGGKLLSVEDKNLLDRWYIGHASLGLDILIAVKTVLMMVRGDRDNRAAVARAVEHRAPRAASAATPALGATIESRSA